MSSSSIHFYTLASASLAAVAVVGLTALQTDAVSRKFLRPDRLQHKRHAEYRYRWTNALQKAKLQLQFFCAGKTTDARVAEEEETMSLKLITETEQLQVLIQLLLQRKPQRNNNAVTSSSTNTPTIGPVRIGKLGTDPRLKDHPSQCNELFLWLYEGTSTIYQVPLRTFATLLADAFDRKITNTTFAFVSDASSGVGSDLILQLVQATKTNTVHIVRQPLWMAFVAVIAEQQLLEANVLERLIFGLCRLEALQANFEATTILVTLPGQSTTSILLPLLQTVFPDDRHVFSYATCTQSVEYALAQRKAYPRAVMPTSLDHAVSLHDPTLLHSTPLLLSLSKNTNVMKKYLPAQKDLPLTQADTVEAWMAAVDAFLMLKEDERKNGYLPFVLRLDYLLNNKSLDGDSSSLPSDKKSDRYWCLLAVLQYVLGARSRGIPDEQVDAALSVLRDFQAPTDDTTALAPLEKKAISNVVFQHKLILIENKILKDTVQPREHWTLKAAAKAGCACCLPEEDENANDMGALTSKLDAFAAQTRQAQEQQQSSSSGSPFAPVKKMNGGYVDGKTTFAFDPSKFTGM